MLSACAQVSAESSESQHIFNQPMQAFVPSRLSAALQLTNVGCIHFQPHLQTLLDTLRCAHMLPFSFATLQLACQLHIAFVLKILQQCISISVKAA